MTDRELKRHKETMLVFCKERNLAIDDIIRRIERFIESGEYEDKNKPGRAPPLPVKKCSRLLIEALDAIKKLTGK